QTYNETLTVRASGAITITKAVDKAHNGVVVIDGRKTFHNGVYAGGRNHVTIDGLIIKNITDAGISIKNATASVIVQNNSVYSGDPGGGNARGYDVRGSVGSNS